MGFVYRVCTLYDKYKINKMGKERGHTVLHLLPYQCELNLTELVWAEVKRYIKLNKTTFKIKNIKELIHKGFEQVALQKWRN